MHEQEPPIIHRDLKVENCLLTSTGFIQLCDFGSATTKIYLPDETWTVKKRDYVEDEMTKVTTPMYRAPEMLDTYNNYPINEQVDIWVLEKKTFEFFFEKNFLRGFRHLVVFYIIYVLLIILLKIQRN
jgi:cyclin G-associated kinase